MDMVHRFTKLCDHTVCANADEIDATVQAVRSMYGHQRVYHNFDHIADCLHKFDEVRSHVSNPFGMELAIFFHDCIYTAGDPRNERLSACFASMILSRMVVYYRDASVDAVEELILATRHDGTVLEGDCAIIADIDASGLGSDAQTYRKNSDAVKAEYFGVPDDIWRKGRRVFLENWLARNRIYHTEIFRDKYERQARQNMTAELAYIASLGY